MSSQGASSTSLSKACDRCRSYNEADECVFLKGCKDCGANCTGSSNNPSQAQASRAATLASLSATHQAAWAQASRTTSWEDWWAKNKTS
ncbi:hypothetical protein L486_02068 [Kwoniella mangroviensis CBS 10435]|uniref:Uncharacterized protein n=1 Tax=Kwoniella mangroviensis CBS 10435 TaxID=1331196 RepID=A0A1B9IV53_9TREE|nr:hypothetical protein L486_02068 [Kwoniella mangroviensis CBS 10435]